MLLLAPCLFRPGPIGIPVSHVSAHSVALYPSLTLAEQPKICIAPRYGRAVSDYARADGERRTSQGAGVPRDNQGDRYLPSDWCGMPRMVFSPARRAPASSGGQALTPHAPTLT